MRKILVLGLISALASVGLATGQHGNITVEGPTGMFLNPTSSVLNQREFIIQYCAAILEVGSDNIIGHNVIASYGVTDRLELGAFGAVLDLDNAGVDKTPARGGPFGRVLLLKEGDQRPEITVGGISVHGDSIRQKHTIFLAGSKRWGLLRLHVGARQFWLDEGNDQIGFLGGEIALPKNIYLVSEISSKPEGAPDIPYSFGLQVRHPQGFGLSIGAIQPGNQDHLGIFIGIGVNFE